MELTHGFVQRPPAIAMGFAFGSQHSRPASHARSIEQRSPNLPSTAPSPNASVRASAGLVTSVAASLAPASPLVSPSGRSRTETKHAGAAIATAMSAHVAVATRIVRLRLRCTVLHMLD